MGIPRVGCHSPGLGPQSQMFRPKAGKNSICHPLLSPGHTVTTFIFSLFYQVRGLLYLPSLNSALPAEFGLNEGADRSSVSSPAWVPDTTGSQTLSGAKSSHSAALPWKPRLSQPHLRSKQPLFIFLPTAIGLSLCAFFIPLLSQSIKCFSSFFLLCIIRLISSPPLCSFLTRCPEVINPQCFLTDDTFTNNDIPVISSLEFSGRILFILYLSCLHCKLFRIRTFHILCPTLLETWLELLNSKLWRPEAIIVIIETGLWPTTQQISSSDFCIKPLMALIEGCY